MEIMSRLPSLNLDRGFPISHYITAQQYTFPYLSVLHLHFHIADHVPSGCSYYTMEVVLLTHNYIQVQKQRYVILK